MLIIVFSVSWIRCGVKDTRQPIGYEGLDGSTFNRGGVLSHYQESIQAFGMDDLTSSGYLLSYHSTFQRERLARSRAIILP